MASDYRKITEENERQLGLDTASRKTQIYLYSDPTHFIYELLQNADDYEATEVSFELRDDSLIIEHNGIPFAGKNVEAITYFGKSTSKEDLVKTGRFGIGFKSVFAFTATPVIISGDEHFQIYGLYRVHECPYPEGFSKERTRIVLPFNHESERPDYLEEVVSPDRAYSMIGKRLGTLNMRTLLFTKNIKEIRWKTKERSGEYLREDSGKRNYRETTITDGEQIETYRVYSRPIVWEGNEHKPVELALAMDDGRKKFRPVDDCLYVLFPTAQETRFRFIVNGPFRTNPSRETVSDEDAFNRHIMHEAAQLTETMILSLRDEHQLDIDFFSILPNKEDKLRSFFMPIHDLMTELFKIENLIPTIENDYALASQAYRGPRAIRDVIGKEELRFFTERNDAIWSKGVRPNSREEKLLEEIGVKEWGWQEFADGLNDKFWDIPSYYDDEMTPTTWIESKSDEWMKRLYLLISECVKKHDCDDSIFEELHIVRVEVSRRIEHFPGNKAKFPKRGYRNIPQVKKSILEDKNKKKTEDIKEALRIMGVSEIGELEEIKSLLDKYYKETPDELPEDRHLEHIEAFISFSQKERSVNLFKNYKILKGTNGKYYKGIDLYIDFPYEKTGLERIFENISIDINTIKTKISHIYTNINDDFVMFARQLGVMFSLEVYECKSTKIQEHIFKKTGKETSTTIDKDYFINGLVSLSYCCWHDDASPYFIDILNLEESIHDLSYVVWETVRKSAKEVLTAYYMPNESRRHEIKKDTSYLVKQLRSCRWIPGKDGKFYYPADMTEENLHPDFEYDNSNGWLDAIGFGENVRKQQEKYRKEDQKARELGFESKEKLDRFRKAYEIMESKGMTPEDLEVFLEQNSRAEFPSSDSSSSERRKERMKQRYADAPEKKYEERSRRVRVSGGDLDKDPYLRRLYTNEDGKMVCQICHGEMPFKKRDGRYYFEAVEMLNKDWFSKEHEAQYLALCPLCSAKYKEFVKRDEENMEEFWDILRKTDDLSVPLRLGEERAEVRFVGKHLQDLKVILET